MDNIYIALELKKIALGMLTHFHQVIGIHNTFLPHNFPCFKVIRSESYSDFFLASLKSLRQTQIQSNKRMVEDLTKQMMDQLKKSKGALHDFQVRNFEAKIRSLRGEGEQIFHSLSDKLLSCDLKSQHSVNSQVKDFMGKLFWSKKCVYMQDLDNLIEKQNRVGIKVNGVGAQAGVGVTALQPFEGAEGELGELAEPVVENNNMVESFKEQNDNNDQKGEQNSFL